MKCSCCNNKIEDGKATCPICGFPVLIGIDNKDIVESYRNNKLSAVKLLIKVYSYTIKDEQLENSGVQYIPFINGNQLMFNEIKWMNETYEEIPSDRTFEVTVLIQNGETKTEQVFHIKPEKSISHTFVGIVMEDGLTVRLVAGNKKNYAFSEESVRLV